MARGLQSGIPGGEQIVGTSLGTSTVNNKRLYCPQSVLRTTQQVGTRAHLTDGETEAQPSPRSHSWYEASHYGWHTQGLPVTSLWSSWTWSLLSLGLARAGLAGHGQDPLCPWNSGTRLFNNSLWTSSLLLPSWLPPWPTEAITVGPGWAHMPCAPRLFPTRLHTS